MHITGDSLDDLLSKVLARLLKSRLSICPSKGSAREIVAAMLSLKEPRARFSRTESRATLFSCLGELLWYLSGTNELSFIEYYIPKYRQWSDDGTSLNGAYGPRIFSPHGSSQFQTIADIIRTKRDSRQAVIQVLSGSDLERQTKDVPCTCTLQFMKRGGKLHMLTSMRSNDAFIGLPHDVFAFTMIQEIMARTVSCELGTYHHVVGSLHLYRSDEERAKQYLGEGVQARVAMPPMPPGDPWQAINWLQGMEARYRSGVRDPIAADDVDPYWTDLARLLRIKALLDDGNRRGVVNEKHNMKSQVYSTFIRGRETKVISRVEDRQMTLSGIMKDPLAESEAKR